MAEQTTVHRTAGVMAQASARTADPSILVIFGASGDLTKRLLVPALYNLYCDGLLSEQFALIGTAMTELSNEQFRDNLSKDIRQFSTRPFEAASWDTFVKHFYYTPGKFDDPEAYRRLQALIQKLDSEHKTQKNVLFYMATPPVVFSMIAANLAAAGLSRQEKPSWHRLIVEKPFGHDLESAATLSRELLKSWAEDQIYRIDHYLGKETVQNILTFRFANGIFEPLWNKNYVDHIQFTVGETVGVEGRGGYYERAGVLRDMMQNHMFQMLAYLCMETPNSFHADAIRNEKAKLLESIRPMEPQDVLEQTVRGQYGKGSMDGGPVPGYREEKDVNPQSRTETFAAVKLNADNWRWAGVPIFLRSGKRLAKRHTEIVIQFKRAPEVIFRETPVGQLQHNELAFKIQPEQGIELKFQAKIPGPSMHLQNVNMHFAYQEAFHAARGTGYERLIYDCMVGDATLFSRTDLVEAAWRIAQPMLDVWSSLPPRNFPNYAAGSWGPRSSEELIGREGRSWRAI